MQFPLQFQIDRNHPFKACYRYLVTDAEFKGPTEDLRWYGVNHNALHSMFDRLNFTFPFNFTGQPAASVPCGFTRDGLPVALQVVGRWHADTLVLQAAAALEQAAPWAQARPPMAIA